MTLTKPQKIDSNVYEYYLNGEFSLGGAIAGACVGVGAGMVAGSTVASNTGSTALGVCAGVATFAGSTLAGAFGRR